MFQHIYSKIYLISRSRSYLCSLTQITDSINMILIADSGSTKTTWCLTDDEKNTKEIILTAGINPYYEREEEILRKLQNEFPTGIQGVEAIYFYGAGCTSVPVNQIVKNALFRFFNAGQIEVESDLTGAARSLCGHQPGIACILGTGSNSCLYDGKNVVQNVSPLGFLLGDEASGGILGRKLLSDVLKKQLPASLVEAFYTENQVTQAEIMDNMYRKPFPNRYAAQFSRFIFNHISEPGLKEMVFNEFISFFRRNVMQYPAAESFPIHFTGSIAYYFSDILKEAASTLGLTIGKIIQDPIEGLADFHILNRHPFQGKV